MKRLFLLLLAITIAVIPAIAQDAPAEMYDVEEIIEEVPAEEAIEVFSEYMGRTPLSFTPGYGSANDYTFPALEAVGLKQGLVSVPTRDLPQCACVWGNSPLGCHYAHRYNRCLEGNVDFVNVPGTIDPESRMWGGKHPQDLRVELVDAKNHYYTIEKAVKRQLQEDSPVKYIKAVTHNTYDYSDKNNFRRETLIGIINAVRKICEQNSCKLVPESTESDVNT